MRTQEQRDYDQKRYWEMRADPALWAAYRERKNREVARLAKRIPGYEGGRKARWRAANPEHSEQTRRANHEVDAALRVGVLIRPDRCQMCNSECKTEAHHASYEPKYWLAVRWLCRDCHSLLHYPLTDLAMPQC